MICEINVCNDLNKQCTFLISIHTCMRNDSYVVLLIAFILYKCTVLRHTRDSNARSYTVLFYILYYHKQCINWSWADLYCKAEKMICMPHTKMFGILPTYNVNNKGPGNGHWSNAKYSTFEIRQTTVGSYSLRTVFDSNKNFPQILLLFKFRCLYVMWEESNSLFTII